MTSLRSFAVKMLPASVVKGLKGARVRYLHLRDNSASMRRRQEFDVEKFSAARAASPQLGGGTVVLASTGVSNIGDQAMLDAVLAVVPGPVTVIAKKEANYRILREDVELLDAADAVYSAGHARARAVERIADALARSRYFCIVGADIVDGGYQRGVGWKTWSLAAAAAKTGTDTRVLGFSWGTDVDDLVKSAAAEAVAAGARALCRDSVSRERFERDTRQPAELVADVVFTLRDDQPATAEDFVGEVSTKVRPSGQSRKREADATAAAPALVNVSGLIASRSDVAADYVEVCRKLYDSGRDIVMVPHVANPGGNDLEAIAEVSTLLREEGIAHRVVDKLLAPEQIAQLARAADIVVTGRMHLSIISLRQKTPAIVLATQGKVEGLLKDADIAWALVEPRQGMGAELVAAVEYLDANREAVNQTLEETIAELKRHAARNFDCMGPA